MNIDLNWKETKPKQEYKNQEDHLQEYLMNTIIPMYKQVDKAHGKEHILDVYDKAVELSYIYGANKKVLQVASIYHDIGLIYGDRKDHHINSSKHLERDMKLKNWLIEDEIFLAFMACKRT